MNHISEDDLIDYLHHEVSDALDARIHAHLAGCRDCRARFDEEASLGDMLRASARAEEREFPPIIRAQVWAAVRDAEPTFLERLRAAVSPAIAVTLAAVFALLMYFGVPIVRGEHATGSPTVAAAYYFEEHAAVGQENPLADHAGPNAALAFGPSSTSAGSPLIDAADAATLDDVVAAKE